MLTFGLVHIKILFKISCIESKGPPVSHRAVERERELRQRPFEILARSSEASGNPLFLCQIFALNSMNRQWLASTKCFGRLDFCLSHYFKLIRFIPDDPIKMF